MGTHPDIGLLITRMLQDAYKLAATYAFLPVVCVSELHCKLQETLPRVLNVAFKRTRALSQISTHY